MTSGIASQFSLLMCFSFPELRQKMFGGGNKLHWIQDAYGFLLSCYET